MDEQIKKDNIILCEKIRLLTKEIDKNIALRINLKLEINDIKPPAGIKCTKWNGSIINWKNSLRF
jgi:hypothetical protein